MIFEEMYEKMCKATNIAIFTHQKTDADALGSSIAMKLFLEKLGKNVNIFVQKPIHKNYNFLGVSKHINQNNGKKFDLAISLDCPEISRFGIYQKKFLTIKNSIAFDHHKYFKNFADLNYCDETCSSTCLVLYRFFVSQKVEIDKEIAMRLYSGIATDTGRFLYSNLNKEVFDAVGNLYTTNFDFLKVNFNLFQRQSKNEVELFKRGINNIKFFENDQIAMVKLEKQDFLETGTKAMDTFRIIDFMLNVETTKIVCLLTYDAENEYIVSIRTRDKSAMNIAKEFGGGGHERASGCKIKANGDQAFKQLLNSCKKELKSEKN